ncbi:MAG: hypothetical protein JNL89_17630 [Rhodanobacteraceae bacterium]|nr:hypothetical protein [Rhodanobacteraceae bacterium]
MPTEADWKHLRNLKPVVLDRLCARILNQVAQASRAPGKTNHERYLAVFRLIQRRDREIGDAFNDMRRSTAFRSILAIHRLGLFTAEEFAGFSDVVRAHVAPDSYEDEEPVE